MRLRLVCLRVFVIFLLTTGHRAFAQGASATVSGVVVDESGSVVPGATVSIVDRSTAFSRQAVTTPQGRFAFAYLPAGNYGLTAQLQGFNPVEVRDLLLNVGDELTLTLRMKVGDVNEALTVVAEPARVKTSAAVGTVVDREFVGELPLNGRSFQRLIALTPGVVMTKSNFNNSSQFSVNGQRSNANTWLVDGVGANIGTNASTAAQPGGGQAPGMAATGGFNNLVSIDALQEFQIQTSSYAPEYGRTPGGQVMMVTRSGTNDLHGNAFEYYRNYRFDSQDWFAARDGLQKPQTRQHDFGGVLGGPAIRDHLFFFASYERLRLEQPKTATLSVLTPATRAKVPARMLPLIAAMPLPNGPDLGGGFGRFSASYTDPLKLDAISGRVDYRYSPSLTFFGRVNHSPSEGQQRVGSLSDLSHIGYYTDTTTFGSTLVASKSMTNDLRFNFSRFSATTTYDMDDLGGAVPLSPDLAFPQGFGIDNAIYSFGIVGSGFFNLGKSVKNAQDQINIVDALTWISGRHQMKAGVDYRRLSLFNGIRAYNQSVTNPTVDQVLAGIVPRAQVQTQDPGGAIIQNLSLYTQDAWRIGSRTTFTYGLRWELNPVPSPWEGTDLATVVGIDQPRSIALAPTGTPLWKTTYNNFAPRAGVAWEVAPSTILRAGTGVFFDTGSGPATSALQTYPNNATKQIISPLFPLTGDQAAPPVFDPNATITLIYAPDPHLKLPYTYQWNVAAERALGARQTLTATYVGALGRRLLRSENLINPNPQFGQVRPIRNGGDSDYKAFQLQFDRRLTSGLQALASYTWSSCNDVASDDATLLAPIASVRDSEYGPCDYDVQHSSSAAVTYAFPAPSAGNLLNPVLRDWAVDVMFTGRTGFPLSVTASRDIGFGNSGTYRPDLVSGAAVYVDDPSAPGSRRLNRAAFVVPSELRQGTFGRNAVRGFGMWQVDLALRRNVRLGGNDTVQLRAEAFNLFNRPNFADPVTNLSSALFGVSSTTLATGLGSGGANGGFNPLYQVGGPRSVQLGIKFLF